MMRKISTRWKNNEVLRVAAVLAVLTSLAACNDSSTTNGGPVAAGETALPVSLSEIKVALVNKVADPYWPAIWNNPQSEQDWRELEHLAFQVEVGGALLKLPGSGAMDRSWVASADWQQLAEQLSQDGARAVNAVRSRNRGLMDRAGTQLLDTCEACHQAFNPDLPSLDRYGSQVSLPPVSL